MADTDNASYLMSSGLNTIMMVAFAVPGLKTAQDNPVLRRAASGVGVAAAAGLFLMDLFAFLAPDQTEPGDQYAAQLDLQDALDELKADLIDAMWKGRIDDIADQLPALNQGFRDLLEQMKKLEMDGDRYTLTITSDLLEDFVSDTYSYFNTQNPNGLLTTLRAFRNALQFHAGADASLTAEQVLQHQTQTIGIYTLIGSLTASYLKAAVIWKWGRELLLAWQYDEYQKDLNHWTNEVTYQQSMPLGDLLDRWQEVDSNPLYQPPDWEHWINQPGSPVRQLITEVQDMVDYCVTARAATGGTAQDGVYTRLLAELDEMEQAAEAGDVHITSGVGEGEMTQAILAGALRAGLLAVFEKKFAMQGVTEGAIVGFGEAIALWRATAASVQFDVHTIPVNQTWADFAQFYYNDATLAAQLAGANPGIKLVNGNQIPKGTIVKAFYRDALADLAAAKPGP